MITAGLAGCWSGKAPTFMQVSSKTTSDGKTGARGPRQVCVGSWCLMMI